MASKAELYLQAYTYARDRYRAAMAMINGRFDRAMRQATQEYRDSVTPRSTPEQRTAANERYHAAELVASLLYQKAYDEAYERFRRGVEEAARLAWGEDKK